MGQFMTMGSISLTLFSSPVSEDTLSLQEPSVVPPIIAREPAYLHGTLEFPWAQKPINIAFERSYGLTRPQNTESINSYTLIIHQELALSNTNAEETTAGGISSPLIGPVPLIPMPNPVPAPPPLNTKPP